MSYAATRRKRFTAGVLAGALALTVTPIIGFTGTASALDSATGTGSVCENPPNAEQFTDVSDTDPSNGEITCLVNSGVTTGVTTTTYEPNSPVTRRQMALFLKRVADSADANDTGNQVTALPAGDGTTAYTDIAGESAAVQAAVDQLDEAGIANGVTATTFVPDAPVTRRQMAKFLVRLQTFLTGAASVPAASMDYFTDDTGDSGEADLNILAEEGVFLGDGAGHVNPGANITRRQMANVLTREFQVMFENGDIGTLFAPPGNVTVTVTSNDAQQGGTVTGTVSGDNIQQVRVSGCGLAEQTLGLASDGAFTLTIPATQPVGACTLTFVTTFNDSTTETDTVALNVTAPTAFFIGSPLTTQINYASTGAAPDQGREEYTFNIPASFPGPVDVALVSAQNLTPRSGGVEFLDADDNAQADGVGAACGGQIELLEGVVPAGGATSYVNNQAIPADRVLNVVIDSNTPNSACVVMVFRDIGNDNALTLNSDDFPTEPFGLGGGKVWTGPEAAFGASTPVVAAAVPGAEADGSPVNVLTDFAGTRYEWDSNDTFQLGGVVITQAEFEILVGTFDSMAISYNPAPSGVSVFNITTDVGWSAPTVAAPDSLSITTINADSGATVNDVRVGFNVPLFNDSDAVYKVQRANTAGPDGICGTADDIGAGSANFTTVGSVQKLPGNIVRFNDINVPNGCYLYRVQVTNPVSGVNSNSANFAITVPGAPDTGAPTSVRAVADDNVFPGQVDSTDRISILFSEAMNLAAGDILRVQDVDGEFANITLGTGNTFTTVNRGGQTLLTVTLTAAPTIAGDALPAVSNDGILELPLTITNQTGVTDSAGNNLNLGAGDVTIEADSTGPAVTSNTNPSSNTLVLQFNEAVDPASAANTANYVVQAAACTTPPSGVNPVTNAVVSTGTTIVGPNGEAQGWTQVTLTTQNAVTPGSCLNQTVSDVIGNAASQSGFALTVAVVVTPGPTVTASSPAEGDTFGHLHLGPGHRFDDGGSDAADLR